MKLVLYSGGDYFYNKKIDKQLISLSGKKKPSLVYIPSSSDYGVWDFPDFVTHFERYDLSRILYFPIDIPISEALLKHVFAQDILFLSGGNTFYFLKHIRKQKLARYFKSFFERGGVLAGLSAGGIVMTPHIHTAAFPDFDRDDNTVKIKNFKGLNFADFEFFPHYEHTNRYKKEMLAYSKKSKFPLFACEDEGAVIVKDHEISVVGHCYVFTNGHYFKYRS